MGLRIFNTFCQWGQFQIVTDGAWHNVYLNIETNVSFTAIISMYYRDFLFSIEPRGRTTTFQIAVRASDSSVVATKEGGFIHVGA